MCHLGTKQRTVAALLPHRINARKETHAKRGERNERERWFAHFS